MHTLSGVPSLASTGQDTFPAFVDCADRGRRGGVAKWSKRGRVNAVHRGWMIAVRARSPSQSGARAITRDEQALYHACNHACHCASQAVHPSQAPAISPAAAPLPP